jgi:hypothetical protein
MDIDLSSGQLCNAKLSIRSSFELSSNVRLAREVHELKHDEQRSSTPAEMQIEWSAEQSQNVTPSIRLSFKFY